MLQTHTHDRDKYLPWTILDSPATLFDFVIVFGVAAAAWAIIIFDVVGVLIVARWIVGGGTISRIVRLENGFGAVVEMEMNGVGSNVIGWSKEKEKQEIVEIDCSATKTSKQMNSCK